MHAYEAEALEQFLPVFSIIFITKYQRETNNYNGKELQALIRFKQCMFPWKKVDLFDT